MCPASEESLSILAPGPIVQPQPRPAPAPPPSAQVVHSAGRPHSMPSWRGYLPMKFEPITMDQYQITSHFSQKVFLGGISAELTEGKRERAHDDFVSLHSIPLFSWTSACVAKIRQMQYQMAEKWRCQSKHARLESSFASVHEKECDRFVLGFCHVVFRESRSVCELLKHCTRQQRSTIDYFLHIHMTTPSPSTGLPIRTNRLKPVCLFLSRTWHCHCCDRCRFKWFHGMSETTCTSCNRWRYPVENWPSKTGPERSLSLHFTAKWLHSAWQRSCLMSLVPFPWLKSIPINTDIRRVSDAERKRHTFDQHRFLSRNGNGIVLRFT